MTRSRNPQKGLTISDLQNQVAQDVISMIEQDGLTWFQRWAAPRPPLNGVTGHVYSGINTFTISLWMMRARQTDPRFISASHLFAKDPAKRVAQVPKGTKGIPILAAGVYNAKDKDTDDINIRTFYKIHRVWHISQLENVDESRLVSQHLHSLPASPAQRDEALDAFVTHTGARLTLASNAHYQPGTDSIGMPPLDTFRPNGNITAQEFYYATVLHELIHWTGAPTRLNRASLVNYTTAKTERAREELVAELGAVMLGMHLGIQPQPREDNATYIKGWVSLLQDSPSAIFDASSAAGKASSYLMDLQPSLEDALDDA